MNFSIVQVKKDRTRAYTFECVDGFPVTAFAQTISSPIRFCTRNYVNNIGKNYEF